MDYPMLSTSRDAYAYYEALRVPHRFETSRGTDHLAVDMRRGSAVQSMVGWANSKTESR
jgi:hypothetical protein